MSRQDENESSVSSRIRSRIEIVEVLACRHGSLDPHPDDNYNTSALCRPVRTILVEPSEEMVERAARARQARWESESANDWDAYDWDAYDWDAYDWDDDLSDEEQAWWLGEARMDLDAALFGSSPVLAETEEP